VLTFFLLYEVVLRPLSLSSADGTKRRARPTTTTISTPATMISDWEQQMIEDDGQTLDFWNKRAEGQFKTNKVTDKHLLRLSSNPAIDFTRVKKVNLWYCSEITDQGVVALIDKCGDNLEYLFLTDVNKITNVTLKEISTKCQHLKYLALSKVYAE